MDALVREFVFTHCADSLIHCASTIDEVASPGFYVYTQHASATSNSAPRADAGAIKHIVSIQTLEGAVANWSPRRVRASSHREASALTAWRDATHTPHSLPRPSSA